MTDQPTAKPMDGGPCENTDRHLWPEISPHDAPYEALFVTKEGGIGINVGGTVYVKPLREWHRLAGGPYSIREQPSVFRTESGGESQVTKLRVTVTAVVEYEPDPRHYPDCDGDPRRMLALDLACAEEDPFLFLGNRQAEWTVSGEVELSENGR